MRDFLQGKWLGHPLHPLLVHLPIGLFTLAFLCDVLSFFLDWPALVPGAFYAIGLGILTGLIAAIPGFADFSDIRRDSKAKKIARQHMVLNIVALLLYGVSFALRLPNLEANPVPFAPFLVGLAAVAVLSYSGYLGGALVYDDGVAVGRHRRKAPLPDETVKRDTVAAGGFVAVAPADRIGPGQSLRAEIDGTVIAVVNHDGTFHAFQEFCPHRYGPMSEGAIVDGQIECPWHRSCFDLKTGKATKGPAKVDLRTFAVRVENGQIEVKI